MKDGIPWLSPIDFAIIPPKFEACCPCIPTFKSLIISSVTAYVPAGIGLNSPPLATTASSSFSSIFFSFNHFSITSFLYSY